MYMYTHPVIQREDMLEFVAEWGSSTFKTAVPVHIFTRENCFKKFFRNYKITRTVHLAIAWMTIKIYKCVKGHKLAAVLF